MFASRLSNNIYHMQVAERAERRDETSKQPTAETSYTGKSLKNGLVN
jgi:hypothetical protein